MGSGGWRAGGRRAASGAETKNARRAAGWRDGERRAAGRRARPKRKTPAELAGRRLPSGGREVGRCVSTDPAGGDRQIKSGGHVHVRRLATMSGHLRFVVVELEVLDVGLPVVEPPLDA